MNRNPTLLGGVLVAVLSVSALAQSLPPHPRLLFTADRIPELQSRATTPGTATAAAYNQMVTSVGISAPSNQLDWSFMRNLRRMQEVALRAILTGNASYGNTAKNALMASINYVVPDGNNGPYQTGSYACAIANTFDMVYHLLSASEKQAVVAHLEQWVTAIRSSSTAVGSYNSYQGATDNYSFAWSAAIVTSLLAIEGDTSYPNRSAILQQNLDRLNSGWRDPVSPDGSIDESYGYANYGTLWSVYAGIAAENCNVADILSGTNVLKSPRWFASSIIGGTFPWTGDSSPSHKGLFIDPILFYLAGRSGDAEALFGLNRIFQIQPIIDSQCTMAFSPYIAKLLHYPDMAPVEPELLSRFFRDNRNEGYSQGNKTTNFYGVGTGGQALLHNAVSASAAEMSALYLIRDEWMNHSHEDDGQFILSLGGQKFFIDLGYGGNSTAQSTNHNIVIVDGLTGYNGNSTNYYSPPATEGRFLGVLEASHLSKEFDYVRGTHSNMWMMEKATRSVIMVKDEVAPYTILMDVVRKDGASRTYDQLFHSTAAASGAGTAGNPMTISKNGRTLRSVYLSPSSVSVLGASGTTASGGVVNHRNRVRASGVEVSFLSVIGEDAPSSIQPLSAPLAGTVGGTGDWPGHSDKIVAGTGEALTGDAVTNTDGRFVWVRSIGQAVVGWAAAEASTVSHNGTVYLTSNHPVTVSVRNGHVNVTSESPAADLIATVYAPFAVLGLCVNGETVAHAQSGNSVLIGSTAASFPLSGDDRVYTFTGGQVWDGVLSETFVVAGGRATSTNGYASLAAKGFGYYAPRPVALGFDVDFSNSSTGNSAGVKLGATETGDVLTVLVGPNASTAGFVRVEFRDGSENTATATVLEAPMALGSTTHARIMVEFDPISGVAALLDPTGAVLGIATVGPTYTDFRVRFLVREGTSIDALTVFDSEEDGVTPQGLVFWALPNGQAGFAGHAPSIVSFSDFRLMVDGQLIDPYITHIWLDVSGFGEISASGYVSTSFVPLTLREMIYESQQLAIPSGLQHTLGIFAENVVGQQMATLVHQF